MPKINREEYQILKELDEKWKWIARDENVGVWVYKSKPNKTELVWQANMFMGLNNNIFRFIKWEDDEPYSIAELIKDYENKGFLNKNLGIWVGLDNLQHADNDTSKLVTEESGEKEVKKDKEAYDNLYVFEDTIFNSQQIDRMGLDVEWSYVYVEPEVYPLGRNRQLIVNQEENQAEIAENTNGLLVSVGVSVEESMIKALIDIALQLGGYTDEN